MAISTRDIHETFVRALGASTCIALVRCAVQAKESARYTVHQMGLPWSQARDLLPYIRRAAFEARAAAIIAPGVSTRVRTNHRGTSSYVELKAAGVVLTALTRSEPPTELPDALYRETRAQSSQLSLLDLLEGVEDDNADGDLYGCFVHGGRGLDLTLARIYFPLPKQHLLTIRPLDLLAVHAAIVAEEQARAASIRPTEETAEIAMALKKKVKELPS